MASVNFSGGKIKGAMEAKAQFRHSELEERMEREHVNKDIDKSKTSLNTSVKGLSYDELCEMYDTRIEQIDNALDSDGSFINTNRRKDRVTMFCLCVPVPKKLKPEQQDSWFADVAVLMKHQYGEENFIEGIIHRDETHDYFDPEKNEVVTSREHGHFYFVPEHDGKLNGKWFSSRGNINKLNNAIDKMSREHYGCEFMDGTQKKGKTVEELKNKSLNPDALKAYQDSLKQRESELNIREAKVRLRQKQQDARETSLNGQEADLKRREQDLSNSREESLKMAKWASDMLTDAENMLADAKLELQFAKDFKISAEQEHNRRCQEERIAKRRQQASSRFDEIMRNQYVNDYEKE